MNYKIIKPKESDLEENSNKSKFHTTFYKKCLLCHSKFNYGFEKTKICGLCKLEVECGLCKKKFIYNFSISGRTYYFDKELINDILNKNTNNIKLYCPDCIKKCNPGNCTKCGKFNIKRGINNLGIECGCSKNFCIKISKKNQEKGICLKCGEMSYKRTVAGLCYNCNVENLIKQRSDKFCNVCNKETPHNGNKCLICNPESISASKPNFVTKNNIKFYKNTEIHELIRQLDSEEIEIPPGFNKRFGEWYYNSTNILTGEITKLNNSYFTEKDEVLYYYDQSLEDYIPWEEFTLKFSTQNIDFVLPENFETITTFRTQDS